MKTLYDTKALYEALRDAQIAISLRLWNLDELDCRSYLILLLPAASKRTPRLSQKFFFLDGRTHSLTECKHHAAWSSCTTASY